MAAKRRTQRRGRKLPIAHWSHSSLLSFLRNPLAWYKRYVLRIYDTPRTPASIVGVAGHLALEHFYGGAPKEQAIEAGRIYLRAVPEDDIAFGVARTKKARKAKLAAIERDYERAIGHYLEKPPRHNVVGIEVSATAAVPGLRLPVKAIADLVVESKGNPGCLDIVDHKFVDTYSSPDKPIFQLQAVFNYYTIRSHYGADVKRFIVYECKKSKNADGRPQLRRYVLEYEKMQDAFTLFHRLLADATAEIARPRAYLPNPSDMFEGEHSVDIYRLGLIEP